MATSLSRISKLLIDREGTTPAQALARRRAFGVVLKLGADVAHSRALQLAAFTAAKLASRCFPGAVWLDGEGALAAPSQVAAAGGRSIGEVLQKTLGRQRKDRPANVRSLIFGDATDDGNGMRVTFDGWIGLAGPEQGLVRRAEGQHCSLAPILAAALAVSEIFLGFAGVDLRAERRVVGYSLWRPDLDVADEAAVGPRVEALPAATWLLGLGHLGNAYLWALATLPHAKPEDAIFHLLDFDSVEDANVETGVLFTRRDVGRLKTRTCAAWLKKAGFTQTRLVERRFDEHFRRRPEEPALVLSGFDNNEARHALVSAEFGRVVDSGLGGKASNFDAISFRTWPNARTADDIWPLTSDAERATAEADLEQAAAANPGYRSFKKNGACGLAEFAGKSVAVPFVGAAAATFVVADLLRLLNDGRAFETLKLRLGSPGPAEVQWRDYSADDLAAVTYTAARGP